jgi:hypothetical protein
LALQLAQIARTPPVEPVEAALDAVEPELEPLFPPDAHPLISASASTT